MLSTVYLQLDYNEFVIESKFKFFNGFNSRRVGRTSQINSIEKDYLYRDSRKIPVIKIEAGSKKYIFNDNLNEAEIDWLIKEIKDWLYK